MNTGTRNLTAFTTNIFDGSTELRVGGNPGNHSYLNGALDEVILYKRSLSTADVSWFYNSGLGRMSLHLSQAGSPGTANLIAWWSMDEMGGTRYDSYSINHLTGTKGTNTIAGKQANGAHFVRANNDFMSVADNASVSMGMGATMTVGAWVYLDSLENYQNIVAKRSNFGGNIEYFLRYENNAFSFSVSPDGSGTSIASVSTPLTITSGAWYFVVAGYDGQNLWIEYNNGARQTRSYTSGVYNGTSSLVLGAVDTVTNAEQLNGNLDEAFLYKRSLSAAETAWLYNNASGRSYSDLAVSPGTTNLVSWWKLDESSGNRSDSQSNNLLTDNNTVTSIAGKKNNAAHFTLANSEYLSIPDNSSVSMGSGNAHDSLYLGKTGFQRSNVGTGTSRQGEC